MKEFGDAKQRSDPYVRSSLLEMSELNDVHRDALGQLALRELSRAPKFGDTQTHVAKQRLERGRVLGLHSPPNHEANQY